MIFIVRWRLAVGNGWSGRGADGVGASWIRSAGRGAWRAGEEGGSEHGQGDPSVPGGPAADLVLVQVGKFLAAWNRDPAKS